METQAPDRVTADHMLFVMAKQLADVLDYEPVLGTTFPGADLSWVDPNQPPMPKVVRHKYVHGPSYRYILKFPRHLTVTHEDYIVWVEVDSTYKQWHVHTNGNPNALERKLYALFDMEDSPWSDIRNPWMLDVQRRTSITRPTWDVSTRQTQTRSHPDSLETPQDSSTPKHSKIVPTFGDLSSLERRSSQKRG